MNERNSKPQKPSRRRAIKTMGAAGIVASLGVPDAVEAFVSSSAAGQGAAPSSPADLDRAMLMALAEVVLPSEIGASGRTDAVGAFMRWLRNYHEGAEMDHGYGFTRLRVTSPSPAGKYAAQLAAFDAAARARGLESFARAPVDERRVIVQAAVADAKVERLPNRPTGACLATDLMGHYFHSSAASDLCYRAAIGRDACRGLPGSENRPAPLKSP
jgi:hypothetical protein